jgi:hypothetical protein
MFHVALDLRHGLDRAGVGTPMALLTDPVRLGQPAGELPVHLVGPVQPERVQNVSRRVLLGPSKSWAVNASGEHQMSVQVPDPWHERRKAHPYVQRDAGLLGQHGDRAEYPDRGDDRLERLPYLRELAGEMMIQIGQRCAGVGLVGVGERPPAARTVPERPVVGRTVRHATTLGTRPAGWAPFGVRHGASEGQVSEGQVSQV